METFVKGEKDFIEGKTISAAVMVEPGRMVVQQLPWPKLERGALILKMHMAGICGTDKHAYRGGIEKILYELDYNNKKLLFTGGDGKIFKKFFINTVYEPYLTIKGGIIAYHKKYF